MSNLQIGMPVHNGEKFLEYAIQSIIDQTYTDWNLQISDNASIDRTAEISKSFAEIDPRITYIRQDMDIGPLGNFHFLLNNSDSLYFMWAASDDVWDESFISSCIKGLESDKELGWAFSNMVNIDSKGRIIRKYNSFRKFATPDPVVNITNYVLDPDILGKPNLIYAVYRAKMVKEFLSSFLKSVPSDIYGFDMALNLGTLCRAGLHIDERVLFQKRLARDVDENSYPNWISIENPYIMAVSSADVVREHSKYLLHACEGTKYYDLVASLVSYKNALSTELKGRIFLPSKKGVFGRIFKIPKR